MPQITCKRCGKEFHAPPSRADTAKFCSKECHYNTPSITCPICGKQREIKRSHLDKVFTCGDPECTHKLKWRNFSQKVADRIGEPLESAVARRYVLKRLSYREIAEQLDINFRTVKRTLQRLDIEPRHGSKAVKTQWENNDERREAIGEMFGKLSKKRTGPEHPNWQGGYKYDQNDERWHDLAKEIRQRDGLRCTRCGMTQKECYETFGRNLSVHHIVPFHLSHDNSPSNLRTLCISCHHKIENEFLWVL